MAGTTKDIVANQVQQGPGDLWVIGTPPVDGTPRLTLASDGTPDATTHGTCVHLGAMNSLVAAIKPKMAPLELDQFEAPFDSYVTDIEATMEAEMAQTEAAKLARALGVCTYSAGSGYKQATFGGTMVVPTLCVAGISPKRTAALQHFVTCLFSAAAVGGFEVHFGRAKMSTYKLKFLGFSDLTRTAGKQLACWHETLANAAGGTPTAKDTALTELYQGPGDLWLIAPAPTDVAVRVTLDASTLTPDSTAHENAKHLGATNGEISMTATPKIGVIRVDQVDAPIGVFIDSIEAKIETEMSQTEMQKMAYALGVGTYLGDATPPTLWKQLTAGGVDQPAAICVAAIAKKRSDPTKAAVACLYRVQPTTGIEITMSRRKQSTYKVTFSGYLDLTRTAGKQMGVFHEMV